MGADDLVLLAFLAFAVLVILAFKSAIREALEALLDEINNRRGGPPTHPLPANDAPLLRRRLPRKDDNRFFY